MFRNLKEALVELGLFSISLAVANLAASQAFHEKLGSTALFDQFS